MNAHVPYTRSAIQLIRNGATAADLGWAASMYESVCRSHGIQCKKPEMGQTVYPDEPAHELIFRSRTNEVIRASIVVFLTPAQSRAFKPLYDRYTRGDEAFMNAVDISEAISDDCTQKNAAHILRRINARLTPLHCWIETKMGAQGGFRLRVES